MEVEIETKTEIEDTNETVENVGGRTRYSTKDNIVIEDIIANFEGGWIQRELNTPNNGIQIREKRVWAKVANEFNKRQNKSITADQLRKRHNCCKSFHKNKLSASNSQSYDDVISFIKVQKNSPIDLLELAKNPESLSNQRAEYFLAKSNIEPASVWSALLIHVLKDLIQARYLVEDGILMLDNRQLREIKNSSDKNENTSEPLRFNNAQNNIENLQEAEDKILEGIKKYSYVEQFLDKSIRHQDDITHYKFIERDISNDLKSDNLAFSKNSSNEIINDSAYEDVPIIDYTPDIDLKQDIDEDRENQDLKIKDIIYQPKVKLKKERKSPKNLNKKSLKAGAKRRKFGEDGSSITCEHCGETCDTKRKFYNHMRKHLQDNAIICDVCNKGFQYKSQYELHVRKHTGERPYRCHICAAGFTQKNVLVDHLRTHTGEKPFKCEECHLEFTQRSNLKSHMTIHSGEKPYKCEICHKSFRLKDSLREHESLHTGVKAYKCDHCLKEFRVKGKLRKHMRKQHNITDFSKANVT